MLGPLHCEGHWLVDRPALNFQPSGWLIAKQPLSFFGRQQQITPFGHPALQRSLFGRRQPLTGEAAEVDRGIFLQIGDLKWSIELTAVMGDDVPVVAPSDL